MKKLFALIVVISINNAFTQTDYSNRLNAKCYILLGDSYSALLWMNQLSAHIGIQLNERLSLQTGFGKVRSLGYDKRPRDFHYYTNEYALKFRIFKPKHYWSPTIKVNIGYGLPYKQTADTAYLNYNDVIENTKASYTAGLFYEMKPYYSLQLGVEYHWDRFRIDLGIGPQKGYIRYRHIENTNTFGKSPIKSWVGSLGISYQLRFRKAEPNGEMN